MAHPARRITRKDIRRPDPFITFSGKFLEVYARHKTQFLVGAIVVLTIFLLFLAWDFYTERQNRLAAEQFSSALGLYHQNKHREALESLEKLASYRTSRYRSLGLLYQAHTYIALNDDPKAEAALQDFLRMERNTLFLRQLAFLTLAQNQERTGRCKDAIRNYSEAEALHASFKEEALLGKARCSAETQNFNEALNSYRQFASTYPASHRAKEAALLAQEMETKVSAAGGK